MSDYKPPRYDEVFREGVRRLEELDAKEASAAAAQRSAAGEPRCKVCGSQMGHGPHAEGMYSHPFESQERVISNEAWERARKLSWPHLAGQDFTWLAAAVQTLMDERDCNKGLWHSAMDRTAAQFRRAEAAEADAALAWRRVTELQERGTQLVEERRAVEAKLAALIAEVREHANKSVFGVNTALHAILDKHEAKS